MIENLQKPVQEAVQLPIPEPSEADWRAWEATKLKTAKEPSRVIHIDLLG